MMVVADSATTDLGWDLAVFLTVALPVWGFAIGFLFYACRWAWRATKRGGS